MARPKNPELERQRKQQIIDTVMRLLVEGSHRSLTLAEVARQTGVSKGMVTYYFRSKDQLVVEAITHFLQQQEQLLHAVVHAEGPVRERVRLLIEAALPSRKQLEQQLRLQTEVWSFAKEVPEALDAVRDSYLRFRRACEGMLEIGVAEGYVTAPDAASIYLLLHALMDGISFQLLLDESIDLADVRARIVTLVDQLLTTPS